MFPKRYWFALLTYVLMHLSIFITFPLLNSVFKLSAVDSLVYGQLFAFFTATIITILILKNTIVNEYKASNQKVVIIIGWSVLGVFLAFLTQMITASIEVYVLGIQPGSENTEGIMKIINESKVFLIIPAIFAPILEEFVFRKIIFGSLHKKMNFFLAAIISSIAFAAIHMDFSHLLVYTGMGFIFAFLYVKSKTIIVPILAHMGMNTITVISQLLIDVDELEKMKEQLESLTTIIIGG